MTRLYPWAIGHPVPAIIAIAIAILVLVGALWALVRSLRDLDLPPAAVVAAAIAAAGCTAYSADTSWRFAADHLAMASPTERAWMFAAGEMALFATALMARQNLNESGSPGVPGVLVWVITGVQIIPAFAESGVVGGTVRAFVGPILAAVLWHLAMGIELRHAKPGSGSQSLAALITREARERLLSRLGLATRDRTAEQITRDRAMARAVRLGARANLRTWGRYRLASAVARARVGTDSEQKHRLLQDLAARRTAGELNTVPLPSPWKIVPEPEPYPSTPLGVTGAQLRAMDPLDAIRIVHAAHWDTTPAELASLCTEYGVPVTATLARVATKPQWSKPEDEGEPTGEVTTDQPGDEPDQVVTPTPGELEPYPSPWTPTDTEVDQPDLRPATTAVAAEADRSVVTMEVTISPSELRKRARKLNREVVSATRKPVTVKQLRTEFDLSRRDAAALRRDVLKGSRS